MKYLLPLFLLLGLGAGCTHGQDFIRQDINDCHARGGIPNYSWSSGYKSFYGCDFPKK